MQQWGFKIRVSYTIGKRDFLQRTDEERLNDFQMMLDDPQIKPSCVCRGSCGFVRIIDKLNWKSSKQTPNGFGFGYHRTSLTLADEGRRSFHSFKMCNSFPKVWAEAIPEQKDTIESIRKALTGERDGI